MKNKKAQSKLGLSSKKSQSRSNSSTFRSSKSDLVLHNGIPVRPFSSTPSKRVDPLGFVALSFATPYSPSLLANPIACSFILLVGLASTLYFTTVALPKFFSEDPSYAEILCRLENVFLLYDKFLAYERSGVDMLFADLDNLTLETLTNFYFSLQELVAVRECVYEVVTELINSPNIEFIEGPLKIRINEIHQELRSGGNDLMKLLRDIEYILRIPKDDAIPSFWFEA